MPINRNALIRYKTIDNCLQNRFRKWTLEDLIEACSDALYEYEGIDKGISKRQVQKDIQIMRSEKLGYNAPIIVEENKYYTYEDPNYSITNTPLNEQDMQQMNNAVSVLKQLSGFSQFADLEEIVNRLDDHVTSMQHKKNPVIFFEKNDKLKGLNYIDTAYKAITSKRPLRIEYQSFKAIKPSIFLFSPYVLKEYRNRWFIFGEREGKREILNLALDRIKSMEIVPDGKYSENKNFNGETFFSNMIGVTKLPHQKTETIRFFATAEQTPYIKTKPIHKSQQTLQDNEDGSAIFEITVIINLELHREFLGFGNGVTILSPQHFVDEIKKNLTKALGNYNK